MFLRIPFKNDKIKELLNKDDINLEEILEQDSLSSQLRNSNQKLFQYFSKDDIMEELLNWVLTDKYKDHPKYLKLAKAALSVFTVSKTFQRTLLENKVFLERIQAFTKEQPNSRYCGHFARIIESIIYETKGNFLKNLDDFQSFLIDNITNIALKDLFILLSNEFADAFNFNTELVIRLVHSMNDDNCMFIISTIREIIENDEQSKAIFDSEELIDYLFKDAVEVSIINPLFATEIFRLLRKFTDLSNYNSILQKYSESYEYQNNCSFPYAVSIFGKLMPEIFDYFFDTHSCSQLIEAIYDSFIKKTIEEQYELAKSANLCERIMNNFTNSKTNARLSDLAVLINNKFKESPEFNQSFTDFVNNEVMQHLKIRDNEYGGKIMSSFDYDIIKADEDDQNTRKNKNKSNNISSSSSSSNSSDSDDEIITSFIIKNSDDEEDNEEEENQNKNEDDQDSEIKENEEANNEDEKNENKIENDDLDIKVDKDSEIRENED